MTHQLTTLLTLQSTVAHWRKQSERVALVPTMGALHAGHLALIAEAKKQAKRVIVSIFVNPTQFSPHEDFERYPRPLAADLALLAEAGADAAWVPEVATMYPDGFSTSVHVSGLSDGLDGAARPGHFSAVATVVAKLLHQVAPDVALFGEKDYQQLCVIRRMVADLNLPVEIIAVPTVRETDGLAMSSRNQYLSAAERAIAPALYATLCHVAETLKHTLTVIPFSQRGPAIQSGITAQGRDDSLSELLACAKKDILDAGFASVDYLALCHSDTFAPLIAYAAPARLLAAATLGTTRLIDNVEV